MEKEHKVWNWLMQSSQDPAKFSLTVKGILVLFLPLLAMLLNSYGVHFDQGSVIEQVQILLTLIFGLLGTVMAIVGALRKLVNAFSKVGA